MLKTVSFVSNSKEIKHKNSMVTNSNATLSPRVFNPNSTNAF